MSGFELTQDHYLALDANDAAIREMQAHGEAKARKEAAYNVALGKEMARLRGDGIAASLCEKLAKSRSSVAKAYVDWQMEEVLFATSKEHIQLTKRRADAIKEQIAREWSAAGGRA